VHSLVVHLAPELAHPLLRDDVEADGRLVDKGVPAVPAARNLPFQAHGRAVFLREAVSQGLESQAESWIAWARTPGHDACWSYRDAFFELLPRPGLRTLEVGCGEGRVSRLPGVLLFGVLKP
jgi:hypothetical protein